MSSPHELTGETLDGRYRITKLLGEGGMGHVYEAIHVALGRKVAIKTLHPRLAYAATSRERFIREAKSASSIQHPNVVQITDFGDTPDGLVYFVMERLEGRDLGSLLREQGKLPWARAREILVQIVRALAAAHAQSVIHRDIKPGNCFLTTTGASQGQELVKLLDFGIAKVGCEAEGGEGGPRLTGTGEVFGTASYMAPEQARGEPLDARSDIYSLGVMAYEMLTGQVPFTGANAIHVITKHLSERPRPPRMLEPAILPAVEALVLRAMAREPKDRFASMGELEVALSAIPAAGERGKTIAWGSSSAPLVQAKPTVTSAPHEGSRAASSTPAVLPPSPAAVPNPEAVPLPRSRVSTESVPGPPIHSTAPGVPTPLPSAAYDPSYPSGSLYGVPMPLPSAAYDSSYPSYPSIAAPRSLPGHDVSGELGWGPASGPVLLGSSGESTRPPPGQPDQPTSPSISLRASSQTGRSARFTGPIIVETSPHRVGTPARPVQGAGWVLGAITLVSVASIGLTLMVLRDGAEAPRMDASGRAAEQAEPELGHGEPVAPPVEPPDGPATPLAAATTPEPSEASPDPTDPSDDVIELDDSVPEPSADEPIEGSPSTAAKDQKDPRHITQACVDRRARAETALTGRDWKGLLSATSMASCWPQAEQAARRGMRVQAYADLGQFDECIAAGRGVTSPQIRAAMKTCEEQRSR